MYNHYNPNVQPSSSPSGPHTSQGPCYTPPGYPPFPAHGASPGGPLACYPPSGVGYPAYSPPTHGGSMLPRPSTMLPMLRYVLDQQVSVNITANKWVVGVIVGFVEIIAKITSMKYRVSFEWRGQSKTEEFSHEQLRPYGPYPSGHGG